MTHEQKIKRLHELRESLDCYIGALNPGDELFQIKYMTETINMLVTEYEKLKNTL